MKPEDHTKITRTALKEYLDNFPTPPFQKFLEKYGSFIIKGTKAEDIPWRNWDRAFHWHFHKPKESCHPDYFRWFWKKVKFTLYSHVVVDRHVVDLRNCLSDLAASHRQASREKCAPKSLAKNICRHLGGLLHHIQDMSTPAHVLPIFHGFPAPGRFRATGDQFENFSEENIEKYFGGCFAPNDLSAAAASVTDDTSFRSLYESAAEDTMHFLRTFTFTATVDGKPRYNASCSLFWQEYDFAADPAKHDETAGFGQYGPFAEFFGQQNWVKAPPGQPADGVVKSLVDEGVTCPINGQKWNLKFQDYAPIYKESLRQMVCNTVRALRLADNLFEQSQ